MLYGDKASLRREHSAHYRCMPSFRGDRDAGFTVKPCPSLRNPVPRAIMRGDYVVANLDGSIGVGN
jgi:hypothetical protein